MTYYVEITMSDGHVYSSSKWPEDGIPELKNIKTGWIKTKDDNNIVLLLNIANVISVRITPNKLKD